MYIVKKDNGFLLKILGIFIIVLLYNPTVVILRVFLFNELFYVESFLDGVFVGVYTLFITSNYLKKILNINNRCKTTLYYIINLSLVFLVLYMIFNNLGIYRKYFEIFVYICLYVFLYIKSKKFHWEILQSYDIVIGMMGFLVLNGIIFLKRLEFLNTIFF